MIYRQIDFGEFCDSFSESYKNNFTYYGKKALFNYLEELSEDIGEDIELDTVALCCEYSEYADIDEIIETYPSIKDIDDLRNNTTVIEYEEEEYDIENQCQRVVTGIIIQDF